MKQQGDERPRVTPDWRTHECVCSILQAASLDVFTSIRTQQFFPRSPDCVVTTVLKKNPFPFSQAIFVYVYLYCAIVADFSLYLVASLYLSNNASTVEAAGFLLPFCERGWQQQGRDRPHMDILQEQLQEAQKDAGQYC